MEQIKKRAKLSEWVILPETEPNRNDTKWIAKWNRDGSCVYEEAANMVLDAATKANLGISALPLRQIKAFRYTNSGKSPRTFPEFMHAPTYKNDQTHYRTVVLLLDGPPTLFADADPGPWNVACFGPAERHRAPTLYPGHLRDVLLLVYHNRRSDNKSIDNYVMDGLPAYVFEKGGVDYPTIAAEDTLVHTVVSEDEMRRARALFQTAINVPVLRPFTWAIDATGNILRSRRGILAHEVVVKGTFMVVPPNQVSKRSAELTVTGHRQEETHFLVRGGNTAVFDKWWTDKRVKPDWYLLNHSHRPSLVMSVITEHPYYYLKWKATRDIAPGEALTFAYNDELAGFEGMTDNPLDVYTVRVTNFGKQRLLETVADNGKESSVFVEQSTETDFVAGGLRFFTELGEGSDRFIASWAGSDAWLRRCHELAVLQPLKLHGSTQYIAKDALPGGKMAWVAPFRATNGTVGGKLCVFLVTKQARPIEKRKRLKDAARIATTIGTRLLRAKCVCYSLAWPAYGIVEQAPVLVDVRNLYRANGAPDAIAAPDLPIRVSNTANNAYLATQYAMHASCFGGWDDGRAARCHLAATAKIGGGPESSVPALIERLVGARTEVSGDAAKIFTHLISIAGNFLFFDSTQDL